MSIDTFEMRRHIGFMRETFHVALWNRIAANGGKMNVNADSDEILIGIYRRPDDVFPSEFIATSVSIDIDDTGTETRQRRIYISGYLPAGSHICIEPHEVAHFEDLLYLWDALQSSN
jgi:hypothetical protein